jgi:hypothetical protein
MIFKELNLPLQLPGTSPVVVTFKDRDVRSTAVRKAPLIILRDSHVRRAIEILEAKTGIAAVEFPNEIERSI